MLQAGHWDVVVSSDTQSPVSFSTVSSPAFLLVDSGWLFMAQLEGTFPPRHHFFPRNKILLSCFPGDIHPTCQPWLQGCWQNWPMAILAFAVATDTAIMDKEDGEWLLGR